MDEKDAEIKKRNKIITEKDRLLQEKELELQQKDFQLEQKDRKIEELTRKLGLLPNAHMCTVKEFPNQVLVNKEASIEVILKNIHGKLISNNEDSLSIDIRNQNVLQEKIFSFNIREKRNGCYNVSFTIKMAGTYSFSVLVCGVEIPDVPRRYV